MAVSAENWFNYFNVCELYPNWLVCLLGFGSVLQNKYDLRESQTVSNLQTPEKSRSEEQKGANLLMCRADLFSARLNGILNYSLFSCHLRVLDHQRRWRGPMCHHQSPGEQRCHTADLRESPQTPTGNQNHVKDSIEAIGRNSNESLEPGPHTHTHTQTNRYILEPKCCHNKARVAQ